MPWRSPLSGCGLTAPPGAQFVLNALLYRSDLTPADVEEAGQYGVVWLRARGDDRSARFVLLPLLTRTDLRPAVTAQAVELGAKWSRARIAGGKSDAGVRELVTARVAVLEADRGRVILIMETANVVY